jgi:hypothetical protein
MTARVPTVPRVYAAVPISRSSVETCSSCCRAAADRTTGPSYGARETEGP